MNYIYILLFVLALLLIYMYIEARWLQVTRVDFSKRKGLKVLHISDIHICRLRVSAKKVQSIIKKENPDVIILTGDYIEKPVHASDFLEYLKTIKLNYRTCLCFGNHDYKAYANNKTGLDVLIRELEAMQVDVLQNGSIQLDKNFAKYTLIGIDDLREGHPDIEKATAEYCPTNINIAFSHNPDIVFQLNRKKVDYLFSGHFHGGQIWLPFGLEYRHMRKEKLCKMGIRKGLHKINGINMYINRGLGNVVLPLRFLSRPEITIYNLP